MRKVIIAVSAIAMVTIYSCEKLIETPILKKGKTEKTTTNNQNQVTPTPNNDQEIYDILHNMEQVVAENGKIAYFPYEWDLKERKFVGSKNIQGMSDIDIFDRLPENFTIPADLLDESQNRKMAKYTVQCGDDDPQECDGARECVSLVKACLDGGGCATICTGGIYYIPQIKRFLIAERLL